VPKAPEAGVDLHHDCLARQAGAVWSGSHPPVDLGRDDDLVAAREILHCAAEDLFAAAERIPVRRIEEIDAAFESLLDEGAALGLVDAPCRR
jgi:hypothetical protein